MHLLKGYVYKVGELKSLSKLILKFHFNKKNLKKMSFRANNLVKKYSVKKNSQVISKTIFSTSFMNRPIIFCAFLTQPL